MSDLRALLLEAFVLLAWVEAPNSMGVIDLRNRIDAALSESAPEPGPICQVCGKPLGEPPTPECLALARQQSEERKIRRTAQPPASPSDAKDAARYRWLRHAWIVHTAGTQRGIWMALDVAALESTDIDTQEAFDKTIDAAIELKGKS